MRKLTCALSLLGVLLLAACGGGASLGDGGGDGSSLGGSTTGGSTTGGTTGGTTGSGVVADLQLSAAQPQIIADGVSSTVLTGTLTDTVGVAVPNKTISFVTNAGSLSGNPGSAVFATSVSIKTDSNGKALVYLRSPVSIGAATIIAREAVTGISGAAGVTFVSGPANAVALTASPTTVAPGAQSTLAVSLLDANGNPVSAATIYFSSVGSGNVSSASVTTDVNGRATAIYTAGSAGATIKADAGNGLTSSVAVAVSSTSALVGGITLTLGSSSVAAGFPSGVTLSALVADTSGQPISGKTVNFNVSDGAVDADATPRSTAAVTTSNGIARVTLTPPTHTTPSLVVRVEADGFADESTLAVVPGAANAGSSSITANPSALLADGLSTSTITVVMNDSNGNALPDGTTVILQSSKGTLTTNTSTLSSGRATFTLTAPKESGAGAITVPALSGLSTPVTFTGATTGDPAALSFFATDTQISVAGVGQKQQSTITVTVLDSGGNPIDESKYGNTSLNNLEAKFVTRPNGGETLSGTTANGTIATNNSSGVLSVRTTNGVASLTLQSGTISGIVEIQFSVFDFAGSGFAASGVLPQVSVASGAPASVVFTGPITNAIENLNNGNYRLHGKVDVRDRYGNFVPDGTVVNFALIDSSIVQDKTGATTANSPTLTRNAGPSLITRRCAMQPVPNGEATGCVTDGSLGNADFLSMITRNDHPRGIQQGDLILLRDTQDSDKRRSVDIAPSSDVAVNAQSDYLAATSNAMFWIGSSLSGAAISGFAADGTTMKPGTGVVKDGLAEFRLDYPANVRSILTGCYGYNTDGSYDSRDLRDAVPQSRQVVVSADAGGKASAINAGDFCFKAIAGGTLTPSSDAIVLSAGQTSALTLTLRDGGDTIPLPYLPLSCFIAKAETGSINPTITVDVDSDGDQRTGVGGVGSVNIGRDAFDAGTKAVTVRCIGGDASADITVTPL